MGKTYTHAGILAHHKIQLAGGRKRERESAADTLVFFIDIMAFVVPLSVAPPPAEEWSAPEEE